MRGHLRRAGVRADGGGTGSGWRARRVRAVAGGAGDASEASGSPARVLDAEAARVLFPTRKAKPVDGGSERAIDASAQSTPETRAPFGWGTYVVDVRDDGHVTDVVLLVHLSSSMVNCGGGGAERDGAVSG